jgi:hypothetical protein
MRVRIYMYVCVYLCVYIVYMRVSIYLSVCLSVCLSIYLSIYGSAIEDRYIKPVEGGALLLEAFKTGALLRLY